MPTTNIFEHKMIKSYKIRLHAYTPVWLHIYIVLLTEQSCAKRSKLKYLGQTAVHFTELILQREGWYSSSTCSKSILGWLHIYSIYGFDEWSLQELKQIPSIKQVCIELIYHSHTGEQIDFCDSPNCTCILWNLLRCFVLYILVVWLIN